MIMFLSIAAVILSQLPIDMREQGIPDEYVGRWAESPRSCADRDGQGAVVISKRSIDFYEHHSYLELAQLNGTDENPPEFDGYFSYGALLGFGHEVIRLKLLRGLLSVAVAAEKVEGEPRYELVRCSPNNSS